ncbi:large subunit ribosomal protein L23 [Methylomagnum ishizawai]|uniref:Large ribosomal subunit protein uL23 n=1 Tax=Methylomagnum ishizawai TaxID=1760988 RepID=A0A1Y6D985_9GAMM|nr:50S ribosomal protein L23 [Methylomagnum ishizawai]SMF96774.1 large subunit ribosomal protein L23 [Methylomagnum ishizawai]
MKQTDLMSILDAPIISEKTTLAGEKNRQVVFRVKKTATKNQIKRAVEFLFKVQVESVNVLNVQGKVKRFGRFLGTRSDWKKAYVKLKPGSEIDFSAA